METNQPTNQASPAAPSAYLTREARREAERRAAIFLRELRAVVSQPTTEGFHTFVEQVLRDTDGSPIRQAPIHFMWESHAQWCHAHGVVPVTLAPWRHGKSVQRVCARAAWMIGQDPSLRLRTITNNEDNLKGRVRLTGQVIQSDAFKLLFPAVELARPPGEMTIHVKQQRGRAADPSVIAKTVNSQRVGGGCDVLFIDDVSDLENSVLRPAERPKVIQSVEGSAQSRLVGRRPGETRRWVGYQEQIGTRWHEEDWWGHVIGLGKRYCILVQALNEDNSAIDCAVMGPSDILEIYPWAYQLAVRRFDPATVADEPPDEPYAATVKGYENGKAIGSIPTWDEGGWGKERLDEEEEASPRWHNCGRRHRPFSEGSRIFPHVERALRDVEPPADVPEGFLVAVGADLSSQKRPGNALVTVGSNGAARLLCDVRMGRWSSPQTSDQLTAVADYWQPNMVLVETNGYQASLVEWGERAGATWTRAVEPFVTGSNKYEPTTGIQALDLEFRNGAWVFPARAIGLRPTEDGRWESDGSHERLCKCGWCSLWRILTTCTEQDLRSNQDQIDALMALWFAVSGLNRILRRAIRFGSVGDDGSTCYEADGTGVRRILQGGDIDRAREHEAAGLSFGVGPIGPGGRPGSGEGPGSGGPGSGGDNAAIDPVTGQPVGRGISTQEARELESVATAHLRRRVEAAFPGLNPGGTRSPHMGSGPGRSGGRG